MPNFQTHTRNTFIAGIFAIAPVAITIFIIYKIDEWTRGISEFFFDKSIPVVGVLIALAVIYLAGLIVTVSLGKFTIGVIDRLLGHVPLIRPLYESWKQISFIPGGGQGMFAYVVLLPGDGGPMKLMGFSNCTPVPGDPQMICVFVPNVPNPMQGRLYFAPRESVTVTSISTDEAFKILLSTGNYIPHGLTAAQPG